MTREEKLNKILEMSIEITKLLGDKITDEEIDNIYVKTKIMLEAYKEIAEKGDEVNES